MGRRVGRTRVAVAGLSILAFGLVAALPALGAGQSGDQSRRCSQLTTRDFERIGEHVMGRMLGSQGAHQSMDRLMEQMMGPASERRMHVVMGERFSGCGNPPLPGGYAGMMGAIGMMGGGDGGPGGMMGGAGPGSQTGPGRGYGPGSMMGFNRSDGNDGNNDDAPVGWMIAMMAFLIFGAAAAVYFVGRGSRRRSDSQDPRQLLAHRFARGEIDAEEYRRRSDLLGGVR